MGKREVESTTSNTKRCPRCETTKHKSEFIASRGWCAPCSRAYDRERRARLPAAQGKGPPRVRPRLPVAPSVVAPPTTLKDIVERHAPPEAPEVRRVEQIEPVARPAAPAVPRVSPCACSMSAAIDALLDEGRAAQLTVRKRNGSIVVERIDIEWPAE